MFPTRTTQVGVVECTPAQEGEEMGRETPLPLPPNTDYSRSLPVYSKVITALSLPVHSSSGSTAQDIKRCCEAR